MNELYKGDVERVLDQLRPWIRGDGGDVELVDIDDDGRVYVRLTGACQSCGSAGITLYDGIQSTLQSQLPWVTGVVSVDADDPGPAPEKAGTDVLKPLLDCRRVTEDLLLKLDHAVLEMTAGDPFPPEIAGWREHVRDDYLRQMEREEQCVFPVIESYLNVQGGPIPMMRREHERFRELFAAFEAACDKGSEAIAEIRRTSQAMARFLTSHFVKERESVFRMLETALPEDLKRELLSDVSRFDAARAR